MRPTPLIKRLFNVGVKYQMAELHIVANGGFDGVMTTLRFESCARGHLLLLPQYEWQE